MTILYHVTTVAEWALAMQQGEYRAPSLETAGFIHCCLPEQLPGVLDRYFKQQTGLVALVIDSEKIQYPVQYEPSPVVPELFPHIYGPLNLDAVLEVKELQQ